VKLLRNLFQPTSEVVVIVVTGGKQSKLPVFVLGMGL
jgi:hypothetical protein